MYLKVRYTTKASDFDTYVNGYRPPQNILKTMTHKSKPFQVYKKEEDCITLSNFIEREKLKSKALSNIKIRFSKDQGNA